MAVMGLGLPTLKIRLYMCINSKDVHATHDAERESNKTNKEDQHANRATPHRLVCRTQTAHAYRAVAFWLSKEIRSGHQAQRPLTHFGKWAVRWLSLPFIFFSIRTIIGSSVGMLSSSSSSSAQKLSGIGRSGGGEGTRIGRLS